LSASLPKTSKVRKKDKQKGKKRDKKRPKTSGFSDDDWDASPHIKPTEPLAVEPLDLLSNLAGLDFGPAPVSSTTSAASAQPHSEAADDGRLPPAQGIPADDGGSVVGAIVHFLQQTMETYSLNTTSLNEAVSTRCLFLFPLSCLVVFSYFEPG